MTQEQQLVIPALEAFGRRVNARTPLAQVIGVLRRHNPRAPFAQIKLAAEQLKSGSLPMGDQGPRPDRFDSGTAGAADNSAPADAASASGSSPAPAEVAAEPDPARLDEIENAKVKRAEVAAWAAANGHEVPAKGFLPGAVVTAYRAAMREEYLASLVPVRNEDGTAGEPLPAEPVPTEVH